MNWGLQAVAFAANLFWFSGAKWAGDKKRIGWLLLFASEIAWVALAFMAHLWSLLPWCAVGFVLYSRNYVAWRE